MTNSNKTCGIEALLAVFSPTMTLSEKCDIGYLLSMNKEFVVFPVIVKNVSDDRCVNDIIDC